MPRLLVVACFVLALVPGTGHAEPALPMDTSATPIADGLTRQDAYTLVGPRNFLAGYPSIAGEGVVNAVIEIPTGYADKWEVKNEDGWLHWDMKDGKPRRVSYLPYPCNYGMVPRTVLAKDAGGDGDPLDMLVLGDAVPRGSVIAVRVIGALEMSDRGERDTKLIAVRDGTPFAALRTIAQLEEQFPGTTRILETWFTNYKGRGVVEVTGFADVAPALELLGTASRDYEKQHATR